MRMGANARAAAPIAMPSAAFAAASARERRGLGLLRF